MKATEANLLEFMRKAPQFVIPIFQRPYSWEEAECEQLWGDLLRAGGDEGTPTHFMGSVVYIEETLNQVTRQSPLLVIDGQQRLTTVTILLEALARAIGEEEPVPGFAARKLRTYYLSNPLEKGNDAYKLLLAEADRDTLLALVADDHAMPPEPSGRIIGNFDYFRSKIASSDGDLPLLCNGLAKLAIVDVSLKRGEDNPQLIFESMNSTGRELSQADLIRNFVLMDLEPDRQSAVYQNHWRPMELEFGQEAYGKYFDAFMRHYLTLKTGEIPNMREVYEAFKGFRGSNSELPIEDLLVDVGRYASHYCRMALRSEPDPALRAAFTDLGELRVDVAYPFLLELYDDYTAEFLGKDEFLVAVRLIESYVFRRSVCAVPTNSLNKTFATAGRSLRKDAYVTSLEAFLQQLSSYKRFPNDLEFLAEFQRRDLYNFRSRSYVLRRLENQGRKEPVPVGEYTIEHILPQNPSVSAEWQQSLGADWKRIHDAYLHSLGNLTLTGYNSEYSDKPFQVKRDMEGGFNHSPLRLNEGLGELEDWNESTIIDRGERLSAVAKTVWPAPDLSEDALVEYRPAAPEPTTYAIDDHPNLADGKPMRHVFEAFRREILELDPGVVEEFLKLYVAYKAETNFVDIVPQATRLRVAINMDFPEIYDPRGLCIDVTNRGRWGNGNVEVPLASVKDIPYLMSLVRQSLEKQLEPEAVA
jgi:uncharacterized protein with ParB-like and HNH nuclease domain/predicted transport protein